MVKSMATLVYYNNAVNVRTTETLDKRPQWNGNVRKLLK